MKKICIVGLGNMGHAMWALLSTNKLFKVSGCGRGEDVNAACNESDIIIIAVKPQSFSDFAMDLRIDVSSKLIVSIMAGISVENIAKAISATKIVRVMPNLPLKVGAGFSGWYPSPNLSNEDKEDITAILKYMGDEIELQKEDQIDLITPITGSGPAYFAYLIEALEHAALRSGFDHVAARKMAKATFIGTARLMRQEGWSADTLIAKVASKGGITEVALNHMESNSMDKIVIEAVMVAQKRAKELNDQNGS